MGKIYSQDFHYWGRWLSYDKHQWDMYENHSGWSWYYFYKALHENLPSEKIVSWYKPWGGDGSQIWEDLIDC